MADLEALIEDAVEIADGFYPERIDWEGLLLRLEEWSQLELPSDWDDTLIKKIKHYVRQARR